MNIDWGLIVGLIAIAFVFVALFVEYRSGRFVPRKKLVYRILSVSQLIDKSHSDEFAQQLRVTWSGVEVPSLDVVSLVIECVGRKEIVPEDYHQPIAIKAKGVCLDAFVTKTNPSNLKQNVELDKTDIAPPQIPGPPSINPQTVMDPDIASWKDSAQILIEPLLLNHKSSIEITLLFAEYESLEIETLIAGATIEDKVAGELRDMVTAFPIIMMILWLLFTLLLIAISRSQIAREFSNSIQPPG